MRGLSKVRFDSEENTVKRSKQKGKLKEREVAGSDQNVSEWTGGDKRVKNSVVEQSGVKKR